MLSVQKPRRATAAKRRACLPPWVARTRPGRLKGPVAPAIVNLNHPAHYVHWHFFQMSVPNIVVIVLMIVVFIAAIALPFPKRERVP